MQLFILRHAEAQLNAESDRARPLNVIGEQECAQVGQWLVNKGIHFDLVLSSPYIRTQETWQLLTEQGVSTKKKVDLPDLTPDKDPDTSARVIRAYAEVENAKNILVISHIPLVCYLLQAFSHGEPLLFSTCGLVQIQLNQLDEKGELIDQISPLALASEPYIS